MSAPQPSWKVFFAGVLGGAIDAAPSISGATVYYVLGVYKDLLESISRIGKSFYAAVSTRSFSPLLNETGWKFLLVLKCGVVLSFLLFAKGILLCLEDPFLRPLFFSLFFGFVLGAISLFLKKIELWDKKRVFLFVLSFIMGIGFIQGSNMFQEPLYSVPITIKLPEAQNVSFLDNRLNHVPQSALYVLQASGLVENSFSIVSESTRSILSTSDDKVSSSNCLPYSCLVPKLFFRVELFFLGLLVAGAMLLPGVSGSYVLNIFGYYSIVLSSILEVVSGFFSLQFPLNSFCLLLNLGLGIGLGILVFSRLILWLFTNHHNSTHACVAGVLFGSVWCLWPFQRISCVIDPFHVTEGLHLTSAGAFIPSPTELLHSWPLIGIASIAYIGVCSLQRYTQKTPVENFDMPKQIC